VRPGMLALASFLMAVSPAMAEEEHVTDMYDLVDAVVAAIATSDPAKRQALA